MLPLSDDDRGRRHFPIVTIALIALNVVAFLIELAQPDTQSFIEQWGTIPARITAGQGLSTLLTSMFLRARWALLLGNMLLLWIFGDNGEVALGPGLYLAFYLVCGLAA